MKSSNDGGYLSLTFDYIKLLVSCVSIYSVGYFHFSSSWLFLGTLGYFLLQKARNRSTNLTSSVKAIGQNEKQFILQNFSVRDLPSWVYFPDVERAEWLNKMIKRLWPSISEYARGVIVEVVEPAIASNLPSVLTPFRFSTIDLGDTPPRIGGIKVYMHENVDPDEIVLDMDLILYSDCRIKVNLGKVTAGIKEFQVRGTLRVVMKPIVPKVPFLGAITVCFLDSPCINFTLTDMGNILGLPGLYETLNAVIRNVVDQFVVLPNNLLVQLVPDVDIQRLKYPIPDGVITINVISGRQLKASDNNLIGKNTSDPYCIVKIGARSFTTVVRKGTLEPKWDEHFESVVDVSHGQSLNIEVYDKDQGNKDDSLGHLSIPIEAVFNRGTLDSWFHLEDVKTGSLHLKLDWFRLSNNATDFQSVMEQASEVHANAGRVMSTGFLYVMIQQAANLPRIKSLQEPSPFCNLQVGRQNQVTEVKEQTQNPIWNSAHHFLISNPNVDTLQIVIRDNRTEKKLGVCNITMKMLMTQQSMSVTRPFMLQETGQENANIYLHLQLMALVKGQPQTDDHIEPINDESQSNTTKNAVQSEASPVVQSLPVFESSPIKSAMNSDTTVKHRGCFGKSSSSLSDSQSGSAFSGSDNDEVSAAMSNPALLHVSAHGTLKLSLQYKPIDSLLEVTVHEARNLMGVDKDGLSDPYASITVKDQNGQKLSETKNTNYLKNTLNPVFEEKFEFTVQTHQMYLATLNIRMKNHVGRFTLNGRLHNIGQLQINLNDIVSVNPETKWYDILPPTRK